MGVAVMGGANRQLWWFFSHSFSKSIFCGTALAQPLCCGSEALSLARAKKALSRMGDGCYRSQLSELFGFLLRS